MARLVLILLLSLASPALCHDWYDAACCSGKDCAPIRNEFVKPVSTGYAITLGEQVFVVPYQVARPSLDERYHVCVSAGAIRCLYAPPLGT